jgi:hypothetical protein
MAATAIAIREVDGVLVVDESRTFRQELGQWNDPESFISTA